LSRRADDLTHRAQFVGDLLVRHLQPRPLRHQQIGQTLVDGAKGHFFHQLHQFADARRKVAKDEGAERLRIAQQPIEERARQNVGGDIGLGHTARRVARFAEQTTHRQDAAVAGVETVEHDLATGERRFDDAHRARSQQQEERTRRIQVKQHRARRDVGGLHLAPQRVLFGGGQPAEHRIECDQGLYL
jgi:hypothetical protein